MYYVQYSGGEMYLTNNRLEGVDCFVFTEDLEAAKTKLREWFSSYRLCRSLNALMRQLVGYHASLEFPPNVKARLSSAAWALAHAEGTEVAVESLEALIVDLRSQASTAVSL